MTAPSKPDPEQQMVEEAVRMIRAASPAELEVLVAQIKSEIESDPDKWMREAKESVEQLGLDPDKLQQHSDLALKKLAEEE